MRSPRRGPSPSCCCRPPVPPSISIEISNCGATDSASWCGRCPAWRAHEAIALAHRVPCRRYRSGARVPSTNLLQCGNDKQNWVLWAGSRSEPNGDAFMSKEKDYRRHAAHTLDLAQRAQSTADKIRLLVM